MEHSKDATSRHLGGFVGNLTRAEMTGVVAAAVFTSRPVSVIGPVKTEHGWNLFKLTKILFISVVLKAPMCRRT